MSLQHDFRPPPVAPVHWSETEGPTPGALARRGTEGTASVLDQVLDAVGWPMALIDLHGRVLHANAAAQRRLQAGGLAADLGQQVAWQLAARRPGHARRWVLLHLRDARGCSVAGLLPLVPGGDRPGVAGVLVLSRELSVQALARQFFSREHGLTRQESKVLGLLCDGLSPARIATAGKVALSTVRTQIATIRDKTGAFNMRHLLHQVANMPPMMDTGEGATEADVDA